MADHRQHVAQDHSKHSQSQAQRSGMDHSMHNTEDHSAHMTHNGHTAPVKQEMLQEAHFAHAGHGTDHTGHEQMFRVRFLWRLLLSIPVQRMDSIHLFVSMQSINGSMDMAMQTPANFTNAKRILGASPALLEGKILRGGMGTGMPMWRSIFTVAQIQDLIAYLYSFQFEYQNIET